MYKNTGTPRNDVIIPTGIITGFNIVLEIISANKSKTAPFKADRGIKNL